jgi:hypothetical protein
VCLRIVIPIHVGDAELVLAAPKGYPHPQRPRGRLSSSGPGGPGMGIREPMAAQDISAQLIEMVPQGPKRSGAGASADAGASAWV